MHECHSSTLAHLFTITKMRTSSKACPCVPSMRAYETPERVCVHILRQAVCAQTQGSTRSPAFLQPHRPAPLPHHLGEALLKAHLSSFPPAGPLARTHTCTQTLQGMHTHTQSHSGVHTHAHTRRVRSALTHVGAHSCSYTYSYTQRYTRSYT